MCYFHVKDALNMKTDLLPKGKQDARLMLRDVRILSETGISDFMRRWTIFKAQREDLGWHEFVAYFEKTWVVELPGWNVGYLGDGTPRTNCGLEAKFPTFHRLVGKGKMAAHELEVVLMEKVVPYFTKQVRANTLPPLTLLERQEAARLSLEPSDVLLCRQVGGEQWYFCRKRVLGVGRPTMTEADVGSVTFDNEGRCNNKSTRKCISRETLITSSVSHTGSHYR